MIPALTEIAEFWTTDHRYALALDLLTVLSVGTPALVRALGVPYRRAVPWVVGISVLLAVVSVATGLFNGGTDESFTTPRYLSVLLAGHNPYVVPLVFTIHQVQGIPGNLVTLPSSTTFIYLPLMLFISAPGLSGPGFSLLMVGAWLLSLYLLRGEEWSLLIWGSPVVALWAANGFNDFAPLALLTFSFGVTEHPRIGRGLQFLALGLKQFAPFVVGIYYVARRRFVDLGITLLVTFLYLVPFLLWGPATSVLCSALLLHGCPVPPQFPQGFFLHWNYYLWPVWAVALFGPRLRRWAGSSEGAPYYRARRHGIQGIGELPAMLGAYAVAWWDGVAHRPSSHALGSDLPPEGSRPATGPRELQSPGDGPPDHGP